MKNSRREYLLPGGDYKIRVAWTSGRPKSGMGYTLYKAWYNDEGKHWDTGTFYWRMTGALKSWFNLKYRPHIYTAKAKKPGKYRTFWELFWSLVPWVQS